MNWRWRAALATGGLLLAGILVTRPVPTGAQIRLERGPWVPSWTVAYGGFRQIEALAAVSATEAWGLDVTTAAAPTGQRLQTAFVHVEGNVWRVAQVADATNLLAIAMVDPGLGFAVGDRGAVYRYDGRIWHAETPPTRWTLTDIAMVSAREGWAVGDVGTILRWDGRAWSAVKSPVEAARITAVAAPAPGEAWAVTAAGELLRLHDGEWGIVAAPVLRSPADLAFAGTDRAMIVGHNVVVLQPDGRWAEVAQPAGNHTAVAWLGADAWVVGDNQLFRYRAGEWSAATFPDDPPGLAEKLFIRVVTVPQGIYAMASDGTVLLLTEDRVAHVRPAVDTFWALDLVTTTFGWAGGTSVTDGLVGMRDGVWTLRQAVPSGEVISVLDLVSETDGWAVGQTPDPGGEARLWRWDGQRWNTWAVDKVWRLTDLEMLSADDGWASKGNLIARWDGQRWRQVPDAPANACLGGLGMLEGGDDPEGWFGAYNGLFHLKDGTWDPVALPDTNLFIDVEVADAREAWAITSRSVFRYDGRAWSKVDLPLGASSVVHDVDAPEWGNAWVLTSPEGLFHWDGKGWEVHTLAPMGAMFEPVRLRALRLEARSLATDVWLVGKWPAIGRYRVVVPVGTVHLPVGLRARSLGR